jgi:hypothetical protein
MIVASGFYHGHLRVEATKELVCRNLLSYKVAPVPRERLPRPFAIALGDGAGSVLDTLPARLSSWLLFILAAQVWAEEKLDE